MRNKFRTNFAPVDLSYSVAKLYGSYFRVYEKNNWEELDADYPTSMPRCIDRAAMCTVGNKIYIIGGWYILSCTNSSSVNISAKKK